MLAKLGVGALVLATAVTVPAGIALQQYGMMTVLVDQEPENGPDLLIPVPLALVSFALNFVPPEEFRDARGELAEYGPVAVSLLAELAECPDGILVEVEDGTERVQIDKEGGQLIVRVKTPDEKVRVKVPLWGVKQLLEKVTSLAVG